MSLNQTSFEPALKLYYDSNPVIDMVYTDRPLLALIPKDEKANGSYIDFPLRFADPQAASANVTTALAASANASSQYAKVVMGRVQYYSIIRVANETIQVSKGNQDAFMSALTSETDGGINTLSNHLATALYRSGWGDIGIIGAINGSTITLATTSDIFNFEKGMVCIFASNQSSSTLRNTGGTTKNTVSAVDRSNGIVTFSAAVSTVTGTAVGDYVFLDGNRQDSATPTALLVTGLEGWVPAATPSSTAFFGMDRSTDSRLGGLRLDATGLPIKEALIKASMKVAAQGGKVTHWFVSYDQYQSLLTSLDGKQTYVNLMTNATVSFPGVNLITAKGVVKVIPDQFCPGNRAWGLQLDTWKLYSAGPAVQIQKTDGNSLRFDVTTDDLIGRTAFYGNVGCRAPGFNINVQLTVVS